MGVSYPRQQARTLRFSLGVPRNLWVSPDGATVLFVRTPHGTHRTGLLWRLDVATGEETVVVDPRTLLGDDAEELSPAERARRERTREGAGGIVGYSVDRHGRWAAFALSGKLWATHLGALATYELPTVGAVVDPRLDPTGRRIAYASHGALRVVGVNGADDRSLVEPETEHQVWGQAEFAAAEEMSRYRGYWWAPDGASLLVERFDESPVDVVHVADPANPQAPPALQRYPFAGRPNAEVTLWHLGLDGTRREIVWDREAFEYLCRVSWTEHGAPLIQVMSRDQRDSQVLAVDLADASTSVLRTLHDDVWVELLDAPQWAPGERLVTVEDVGDARRVLVDGRPIGDPTWNVRGIAAVDADGVVLTASSEPTEVQVLALDWAGAVTELTSSPGVHTVVTGGPARVVVSASLDALRPVVRVTHPDHAPSTLSVVSEEPGFSPAVTLLRAGQHELRTAVLFPSGHAPGSTRLPILMDPYGGPHAQRVMASARAFFEPQWLADQGFCVVVADGRGTGGRGPAWDRAIRDDLAAVTLADQVAALEAVAGAYPDDVDTTRVGITGWSYGGYLAALAVLARPDLFHVAVAGAPVTEWRLYDTFYTERYLGDPAAQPEVYDRSSLLPLAGGLERPLMLIHGLADDNVLAAHTLRLSSALLAAGRAHTVLPLSGITHMTPDEVVAENLTSLQVEFLREHLIDAPRL